jgi:uncharacterized Fe-S radical SAM superfamily protein PflX
LWRQQVLLGWLLHRRALLLHRQQVLLGWLLHCKLSCCTWQPAQTRLTTHNHLHTTLCRLKDEQGVCNVGRNALVSTVAPHFAEEAPLQGWKGSGTVFFSMCNLRCVFCQNWDISQQRAGAP